MLWMEMSHSDIQIFDFSMSLDQFFQTLRYEEGAGVNHVSRFSIIAEPELEGFVSLSVEHVARCKLHFRDISLVLGDENLVFFVSFLLAILIVIRVVHKLVLSVENDLWICHTIEQS